MRDFGRDLQPTVMRLVSSVSSWATPITYTNEGILLVENDPCAAYGWDDLVMAYLLYEAPPEGCHFIPVSWMDTLKEDENTNEAVQMRVFGKVKYG
jgi:hypothetical protein